MDFALKSKILTAIMENPKVKHLLGDFALEPVGRPHINPTLQEVDYKCDFVSLKERLNTEKRSR